MRPEWTNIPLSLWKLISSERVSLPNLAGTHSDQPSSGNPPMTENPPCLTENPPMTENPPCLTENPP